MSDVCFRIQDLLAAEGPAALQDHELEQQHVSDCSECLAYLEALTEIDQDLANTEQYDASDELVGDVLSKVMQDEVSIRQESRKYVVVLKRLTGSVQDAWYRFMALRRRIRITSYAAGLATIAICVLTLRSADLAYRGGVALKPGLDHSYMEGPVPTEEVGQSAFSKSSVLRGAELRMRREVSTEKALGGKKEQFAQIIVNEDEYRDVARQAGAAGKKQNLDQLYADHAFNERLKDLAFRGNTPKDAQVEFDRNTPVEPEAIEGKRRELQGTRLKPYGKRVKGKRRAQRVTSALKSDFAQSKDEDIVARFLGERSQVDGLSFIEPRGYWRNTYVPGDPELLSAFVQLQRYDHSFLQRYVRSSISVEDLATQTTQPFDVPRDAAMAVYLHSDQSAVEGQTRRLVQIGLQATQRQSGSRAAMNVGIVVDLTKPLDGNQATLLRALLRSLMKAKDLGDRFSLSVAGPSGGVLIEPGNFRHGTLVVAEQDMFTQSQNTKRSVSLLEAFDNASTRVVKDDDPNAPLGSSAIIVVSPHSLQSDLTELMRRSHASAVNGVQVSAFGLGTQSDVSGLMRLALAGQGNRRTLTTVGQADELVQREISAVSRVVARALRLRIRLAPGVKLVRVIGSEKLSTQAIKRVREAELSVDRRLARNLGIEADRDEDEDSIQMVIPSFYAGDSHAVLLDVVAPGPGAVADVTLRYKDLVFVRNGVAQANLSLASGSREVGLLELNVLKNFLASRLSQQLASASQFIQAHNTAAAVQALTEYRLLLNKLAEKFAELEKDRDVRRDSELLNRYLELLRSAQQNGNQMRSYLSESLKAASKLKVLPRPPEER